MTILEATTEALIAFHRDNKDHASPAAIIMTPPQLKALMRECKDQLAYPARELHQMSFEGVPIWKSWHIAGPCVVGAHLLDMLKRKSFGHIEQGTVDEPPRRYEVPVLF